MRRFNKQFFAAEVSNRIMREFEENSMISCVTYDMIELFYRASGCKNPEEFCSRFVLTNSRTGECFQVLFYEEGIKNGGIGQQLLLMLHEQGFQGEFHLRAIENFVAQSTVNEALADLKLDAASMVSDVKMLLFDENDKK